MKPKNMPPEDFVAFISEDDECSDCQWSGSFAIHFWPCDKHKDRKYTISDIEGWGKGLGLVG